MVCPRLRSVFPLRRLTGLRAAHTVLAKNLPRSLSLPHGFTHGRVKPGKYHVLYTGFTGTGNPLTRDKLSQDLPSLSLQRKYTFSSKLARLVTQNSPETGLEHPLRGSSSPPAHTGFPRWRKRHLGNRNMFLRVEDPLTRDELAQRLGNFIAFGSKSPRLWAWNSHASHHKHPQSGRLVFARFMLIRILRVTPASPLAGRISAFGRYGLRHRRDFV